MMAKKKIKKQIKAEKEEKQENIEIKNAIEEIYEILEPCIKCGMCKSLCPVFKVMREEYVSPRGKVIMLSEKNINDIVFMCTLCRACELKCPLNLKICDAIRKAREVLNLRGKELPGSKEMIKNVREHGNPFGKNPEKSDKLYCC